MKRNNLILLLIFYVTINLFCEIDFQHTGNLYDGYTASIFGNNVVKNGNNILLVTSFGVELYETNENGLTKTASYASTMVNGADLYGDKIALIMPNIEENTMNLDVVKIFEISNQNELVQIHQINTNLSTVFLKENVIILGFNNQIKTYNLHTLELLNTYSNSSLAYNIEDSEYFLIEDRNEGNFYLCHLNSENQLVRDGNLGNNFGRPLIKDNRLLYCYQDFIDFYTISDSLSFDRTFNIQYIAELELPGVCLFDNNLLVPCSTVVPPYSQQLAYYDISNINNIIELENYTLFPDFGQNTSFRIYDCAQWNDNFLFVIDDFGVIYSNFNNLLDDYSIIKYSRTPQISYRLNNYLYVNYTNITDFNNIFDLTNLNDISQVETADTLGGYFWFEENNNRYVVKKNRVDGAFELFIFYDNSFNYLDFYPLNGNLLDMQEYITVNFWDGQDLIYSFGENIYWVRYENGSFIDVYINEINTPSMTKSWFYYNNYFYKSSYSGLIEVYTKQVNELVLENTLTWVDGNTSYVNRWGIKDGLFTIGPVVGNLQSKIFDLDIDPVYLTAEINLNPYLINSLVSRCGDYYFYTGCDNDNNSQNHFFEQLSYLNIYKKVANEFVKVGDIYNHRQTWDLEVIPQSEDNFTVLLCSTRGIDVYSCQATPNGNLDITPVTLNASNYPNPFNPETTISYDISQQGNVSVDIYNIKGQKVKSLLNETQEAGQHKVMWQGDNETGKKVSSGTYFYKIKSDGEEIVNKMLLLK